jgi:hypothetical protein
MQKTFHSRLKTCTLPCSGVIEDASLDLKDHELGASLGRSGLDIVIEKVEELLFGWVRKLSAKAKACLLPSADVKMTVCTETHLMITDKRIVVRLVKGSGAEAKAQQAGCMQFILGFCLCGAATGAGKSSKTTTYSDRAYSVNMLRNMEMSITETVESVQVTKTACCACASCVKGDSPEEEKVGRWLARMHVGMSVYWSTSLKLADCQRTSTPNGPVSGRHAGGAEDRHQRDQARLLHAEVHACCGGLDHAHAGGQHLRAHPHRQAGRLQGGGAAAHAHDAPADKREHSGERALRRHRQERQVDGGMWALLSYLLFSCVGLQSTGDWPGAVLAQL